MEFILLGENGEAKELKNNTELPNKEIHTASYRMPLFLSSKWATEFPLSCIELFDNGAGNARLQ